jgi:hypothetical protein
MRQAFAKDVVKLLGEKAKVLLEIVDDVEKGKKESAHYDQLSIPYIYANIKRVGNEISVDLNNKKYVWIIPQGEEKK